MFKILKKEIKKKKLKDLYWKKTEKTKLGGFGDGGVYRDRETGKDYLVKRVSNAPNSSENWRSWDEILTAKILKAAGILVPNMFAIEDNNGLIHVASSMLPNAKNCRANVFHTLPAASKDAILASQIVHCWLGNRDLLNETGENYVVDDDNRVFNVDLGATLYSGFRSIISDQDSTNFNANTIERLLLAKDNPHFGIMFTHTKQKVPARNIEQAKEFFANLFSSPKNERKYQLQGTLQKVPARNIKQTKEFFADLFSSPENERKYQLQGTLMIAKFTDQDIEDLVNSTGHTKTDKEKRILVLKERKIAILAYIKKKYGEHALQEEQIALELQRIFHKHGIYNKYTQNTGGTDAIVSYRSQYTNAIKPIVTINQDSTISIQLKNDDNYAQISPIIQRLSGVQSQTKPITVTLAAADFRNEIHKELVANSLQIFFSSFGYLSSNQDEFHHYTYKGDGHQGFRPIISINHDKTISLSLPSQQSENEILQQMINEFNIDPAFISVVEGKLCIRGTSLEDLAYYFMQNTGARKTAVVSENKEGKILAGKLLLQNKGVSGFATAGGGSDHPYNPAKAAQEEGSDEFGHSISDHQPLIPIGSTLHNKKKNIFLVLPGGTSEHADKKIGHKEFQDASIKYYNFSEFRAAYKKDNSKFDRSSVDLYLRHYQREIQKSINKLGIQNIIVQVPKKPASIGKIYLKSSIENYNYSSQKTKSVRDNFPIIKLMNEILGENNYSLVKKDSQQGNLSSGKKKIVHRENIQINEDINPAYFYKKLQEKINTPLSSPANAATDATQPEKIATQSQSGLPKSSNPPQNSSPKNKIIGLLSEITRNIEQKEENTSSRSSWFTFGIEEKVKKLTTISTWLANKTDLSSVEEQLILCLIRDCCEIKRNPLGLFSPHSVDEFDKRSAELNLVITSTEKFDNKALNTLNGELSSVDELIKQRITSYQPLR